MRAKLQRAIAGQEPLAAKEDKEEEFVTLEEVDPKPSALRLLSPWPLAHNPLRWQIPSPILRPPDP